MTSTFLRIALSLTCLLGCALPAAAFAAQASGWVSIGDQVLGNDASCGATSAVYDFQTVAYSSETAVVPTSIAIEIYTRATGATVSTLSVAGGSLTGTTCLNIDTQGMRFNVVGGANYYDFQAAYYWLENPAAAYGKRIRANIHLRPTTFATQDIAHVSPVGGASFLAEPSYQLALNSFTNMHNATGTYKISLYVQDPSGTVTSYSVFTSGGTGTYTIPPRGFSTTGTYFWAFYIGLNGTSTSEIHTPGSGFSGWESFVINPTPVDLVTQDLTRSGVLTPGSTLTFSGSVRNAGVAAASSASTARFCIDNAACLTSSTGQIGTDATAALAAGASSPTFSHTWVATLGAHTLYFCTDVGGAIAESSEVNNCSSLGFTVAGPQTLSVTLTPAPSSGASPLATTLTANAAGTGMGTTWTTSFSSPETNIWTITRDTTHSVLYAGSETSGIIYRCDTATLCDASSDWTTSYDTTEARIYAIAFDVGSGVLYAASGSGNGNIYRCNTTTLCDTASDWTLSKTSAGTQVFSLTVDTTHGVIYAGTGNGANIYRCDTVTLCDASSDWIIAKTGAGYYIFSLTFDATHGVLYAGLGADTIGIVYRCDTSTLCDAGSDWTVSYSNGTGTSRWMWSLAFDSAKGVLYAGSGENNGAIFRCDTATLCDASSDWTTSYIPNPSAFRTFSLLVDTANSVLYAGTGNGIIYRCDTGTLCDASTDWSIAHTLSGWVESLAIDTTQGVLYAGNGGDIYRCDTATGCISGNYHFWFNCSNTSTDVATVEAACGVLPASVSGGSCVSNAVGVRCRGVLSATQAVPTTYAAAGTYTPKVIVEAGTASNAEARNTVTVSAGTIVTTNAATIVNATTALLDGTATFDPAPATGWFRYDTVSTNLMCAGGADGQWSSVTYGNGLFVAAAWSGGVMTSPDGTTWIIRTSAVGNNWQSVTYGNGLFVAVASTGSGNRVMTSPDGITWTIRTSAADNDWQSVTYGNGLFVAVAGTGIGNRVMTSPDGVTWTSRASAADNWWNSVTYGNGLFVAVAGTNTGNRVMTSPDGITWTIRTSAADNNWNSVTYGGSLFVAVSSDGTGNRVMTSPNGINWTIRASAADNQWFSVTYGNGLFVAVARGGGVMTSSDGITWTSRTSAASNMWEGVTYGNGLFVAVAWSGAGNRVMTSPDGITWTSRTTGNADAGGTRVPASGGLALNVSPTNYVSTLLGLTTGTTYYYCAIASNSVNMAFGAIRSFVAGAASAPAPVLTVTPAQLDFGGVAPNSNTTLNFTVSNTGSAGTFLKGAVSLTDPRFTCTAGCDYSGAGIAAGGSQTASIRFSPGASVGYAQDMATFTGTNTFADGVKWVQRTAPANAWMGVTYGNGLFVAVARNVNTSPSCNLVSRTCVMTSPDGITWTGRTAAGAIGSNVWYDVTYDNGLFVAVGNPGVMTSPDGITWTLRTPASANNWNSVVYGGGKFVAIADAAVMTSPDGITWTSRTPAAGSWYNLAYGNGLFVAVGGGGGSFIMTSPDGITWTGRTSPGVDRWMRVAYGNGLFVALPTSGSGNHAMTSPDGITWTLRATAWEIPWYALTYGNGVFVGGGEGLMTSSDGIAWERRAEDPPGWAYWNDITYGNGMFVAVADEGNGNSVTTSIGTSAIRPVFGSVQASPTVTTNIATDVTATAATLNGNANPNGLGGAGCAAGDWTCTTIDTRNSVGKYNALAFDPSGNPWVSYQDYSARDLRVARYVGSGGTGCASTAWACTVVDTDGYTFLDTSLVIDSSGTAWVSYTSGSEDLRIARYVGSGGTGCASTAWTCTTVDTPNYTGLSSSIALDSSGNPWVSYYTASPDFNLHVARYVGSGGTGCSSTTAWSCTVVDDPAGDAGEYSSIAFDLAGNAWVSYNDWSNGLRVARYVGSGGTGCTSTAWTCTAVDMSINDGASFTSIAIDSAGNPWVSYIDYTPSYDLHVARYVGSGGTGCTSPAWTCTTVVTDGDIAWYDNPIAFDPSGNALIAYHNNTSGDLFTARYVGSGGTGCASSAWVCTVLDTFGDVGAFSDLTFDPSGNAWISYDGDSPDWDLKIARHMASGGPIADTTAWFRYSTVNPGVCNDTFGIRTPASGGSAIGAGSVGVNYTGTLSGLTTGTTYYYCAIASNSAGTAFGAVASFTPGAALQPDLMIFANPTLNTGTLSAGTSVTFKGTIGNGGSAAAVGSGSGWTAAYDTPKQRVKTMITDSANGAIYAGGDWLGFIYRCATSTGCDAAGDWITSYDTPAEYVYSFALDSTGGVLYAGAGGSGGSTIYRCATSTLCNAAGDWTSYGVGGERSIQSLVVDSTNGVLYAGTGDNGIIYRCATSTLCNAASDWTTSYDTLASYILSLTLDSVNGVLYAGTGVNNGTIYRCVTSTLCDTAGDWTISHNDTTQYWIYSLTLDSVNGVLYAGTWPNGIIKRCATSTGCDAASDWTVSYDTPAESIDSFTLDSSNGVLYAGATKSGSLTGSTIYLCALSTNCDAAGDWSVSYDSSTGYGAALVTDATNDILYAGVNGTIYRCNTATGGTGCGGFENRFQVDIGNNGSVDVTLAPDPTLVSLAVGDGAVVTSGTWTNIPAGTHRVILCADQPPTPNGVIAEPNETNNCNAAGTGLITVVVSAQPDLTASAPTPATATAGTPATFTSTISNGGTSGTGASFSNFFQVATAAAGGGTVTDLTSSTMTTLAAGTNNTATSPAYTFPSSGTYSVRACADKSSSGNLGTIVESNEGNNCGGWTDVVVAPAGPALAVSLTANPATGQVSFSDTLTAVVSGSSGNIDYYFWWDCAGYVGTNPVAAESACGNIPPNPPVAVGACRGNAAGHFCSQIAATTQPVTNTYTAPGVLTPMVIVQRGGFFAQATTSLIATTPPILSVTPPQRDFGNTVIGGSMTGTFTVTNSAALSSGSYLRGAVTSDNIAYFTCISGCDYSGTGIAAQSSQTVTVQFAPGATLGAITGNLTFTGVNTSPASSFVAPVWGAGVLPISMNGGLNFGNVIVNRSKDLVLTITNVGASALSDTLILPFPAYTCVPDCTVNVAPSSSQNITIRFTPPAIGSYNGTAYLQNNPSITSAFTGAGVSGTFKFIDR